MDRTKCNALKAQLAAQPEPLALSIERFFDGNDDVASIGCNLLEDPGIASFREILTGLLQRPDVEAVYAQISEIDPGDDFWPFTDIVLVVGSISVEALRDAVSALEPDEVGLISKDSISPAVAKEHQGPLLQIWWD